MNTNKDNNKDINKESNKDYKKDTIKSTIKERNEEELTFCKFIIYKLFCKKKNKRFQIYNNFRTKIISEEHLMKNHLNVYNLLRVMEKKKKFKRNSYQLKDLIKLI